MSTFEDIVTRELSAQAERLVFCGAKEFTISVEIAKSTYSDTILTSFSCRGGYGNSVKGNNLHDTVTEYVRRQGWNEANKPMTLIGVKKAENSDDATLKAVPVDDEIPF